MVERVSDRGAEREVEGRGEWGVGRPEVGREDSAQGGLNDWKVVCQVGCEAVGRAARQLVGWKKRPEGCRKAEQDPRLVGGRKLRVRLPHGSSSERR
jgi:hypothetical protein